MNNDDLDEAIMTGKTKVVSRGGYNYFDVYIEDTIKKANIGDTEAAKKLMEWFCGAIVANTDKDGKPYIKPSGTGTQIDERILRYFGECFQRVLSGSGVEVNLALNLKNPANRPPDPKLKDRDKDITLEVLWRLEENAKPKRRNLKKTKEIIYTEVGNEYKPPLGFEAIKKIVGENMPLFEAVVGAVKAKNNPSILAESNEESNSTKKGK